MLAGGALLWLALYELHILLAPRLGSHSLFDKRVHLLVLLLAAGLILVRAARRRTDRLAWTLIGLGVLAWALGEVYFTAALWNLSNPPVPSPADAGYLLFPVLSFAGICRLARARVRGVSAPLWADGLTAALAVGSVSAAFVFEPVFDHVKGHTLEVATNLAYPVTDLVLLALCTAVVALRRWRLDRTWGLLAVGVIFFWVADSLYLVETALGTYQSGGVFDPGWWLGLLLIGMAAWQPTTPPCEEDQRTWMIALPLAFAGMAAGVLTYGCLRSEPLEPGLVALALAALAGVGVRLVMTFRASLALLAAVQADSLTDPLTGMGNRRALMRALEERLQPGVSPAPAVLAMFDLDGFKRYNDTFGHQAGDALLRRLGEALNQAVEGAGSGFRMGGDEFCVLLEGEPAGALPRLEAAAAALSEEGEGFRVSCSWGTASLPEEAGTAEAALRIADQRMYAHKEGGRPSASRQTSDVLLRALAERHPDLDEHVHDVAVLAEGTGRRLGLGEEELEQVRLTAELHDIGKVAIPEAILNKPGPLNEQEWQYMKRHAEIGERIIAAAPSLQRVAQMVRSSHERYDGGGYPDGLRGAAIPLGARIVGVCDAYDAMVSLRPYSPPKPVEEAVAELRRCAGTQFDPVVVEAFCAALAEGQPRVAPMGELVA